jgi:DNA topoisomerase-1
MTIIERLQSTGIRRAGSHETGFRFRYPGRGGVTRADRARILALKIPPAWKRVAIHASPGAAVQAVGMDRAGRWQYLYHKSQTARRERRKQERLVRFIAALPKMRRAVARDLRNPGVPREKVLAGILRILATCFLRPGSKVYADENGSYGITTLRKQHVAVKGGSIRFDFNGKSGRRNVRELRDRRVAALVRELIRFPGEVFKFRSEDGVWVDVQSGHINAYIREIMGEAFSAKDFRTWAGTLLCACALARRSGGGARTKTARKRNVREAIREVAEHLGNTPAVCRSSYVFPTVIRSYEEGRVLREYFDHVGELTQDRARKVERSERALLELLR